MDTELSAAAASDIDLDIQAEVSDALLALDFIGATRAEVNVRVNSGHVTLDGYVQSPMAVTEAGRAAEAVREVTGVTNRLADDGSLSRQVAEILGTDPATREIPPGYEVTSVFGYLHIIGRFTDEQARSLVAVAQAIPAVREVSIKTF